MEKDNWLRIKRCIREVVPSSRKTCWWIIKITVGVSFAMMLLKWFGILPWISTAVSPLFRYFGLPGSAALAYVSGYFVNCYTAIAVISTLGLGWREATILCTMVLASHSMILETAVLKKTGVSGLRMVIVRTLSAIILGFVLNLLLPGRGGEIVDVAVAETAERLTFWLTFRQWLLSTLRLVLMIIGIIFTLNIVQRLLSEFGIMNLIAKFLSPLMLFFGLPSKAAFLWIVANIVGLAYGAAAMLDEIGRGSLSKREVNIVDSHICISHSNIEDLSLMSALGGAWWVMLLARWAMSMILVWELRLEYYIKDIVSKK